MVNTRTGAGDHTPGKKKTSRKDTGQPGSSPPDDEAEDAPAVPSVTVQGKDDTSAVSKSDVSVLSQSTRSRTSSKRKKKKKDPNKRPSKGQGRGQTTSTSDDEALQKPKTEGTLTLDTDPPQDHSQHIALGSPFSSGTSTSSTPPRCGMAASLFDPHFFRLLKHIFSWNDDDPIHEVIEALIVAKILSWDKFVVTDSTYFQDLYVQAPRERIRSLSTYCTKKLTELHHMFLDTLLTDRDKALDVKTFTHDFVTNYMLSKRLEAHARISDGSPAVRPSEKTTVSPHEKALKAWNSAKRQKESFPQLTDDAHFSTWRIAFVSEVKVQRMTRLVDRDFAPLLIRDVHDEELLTLQQVYFWTVLIWSLKNPLGMSCIQEFLPVDDHATPDSIGCYFQHLELQSQSVAQPINLTAQFRTLQTLRIKQHRGSRVAFITKWFGLLQLYTHSKRKPTEYYIVRSMLTDALDGDTDLRAVFADIPYPSHVPDEMAECQKLKHKFIQRAPSSLMIHLPPGRDLPTFTHSIPQIC